MSFDNTKKKLYIQNIYAHCPNENLLILVTVLTGRIPANHIKYNYYSFWSHTFSVHTASVLTGLTY